VVNGLTEMTPDAAGRVSMRAAGCILSAEGAGPCFSHEGSGGHAACAIAWQLLVRWQLRPAAAPAVVVPVSEAMSPRESRVLGLAVRGFTCAEAAQRMEVSLSTVQSHLRHVNAKLDVRHRTEAVFEARQPGLLRA
jgi:DNA-binding CsgD family transcriptional regulator